MDASQVQPMVVNQDHEIQELLAEIDEQATRQGDRWAEKRAQPQAGAHALRDPLYRSGWRSGSVHSGQDAGDFRRAG